MSNIRNSHEGCGYCRDTNSAEIKELEDTDMFSTPPGYQAHIKPMRDIPVEMPDKLGK